MWHNRSLPFKTKETLYHVTSVKPLYKIVILQKTNYLVTNCQTLVTLLQCKCTSFISDWENIQIYNLLFWQIHRITFSQHLKFLWKFTMGQKPSSSWEINSQCKTLWGGGGSRGQGECGDQVADSVHNLWCWFCCQLKYSVWNIWEKYKGIWASFA